MPEIARTGGFHSPSFTLLSRHGHTQPREEARDPEAASAGFVADVKMIQGKFAGLGNAADDPLQGVLAGGHAAVDLGSGLAMVLEGRNHSLCFMDVESEIECPWCV